MPNIKLIPFNPFEHDTLKALIRGVGLNDAKMKITEILRNFKEKLGQDFNIVIGDHCFANVNTVANELDDEKISRTVFYSWCVYPAESELTIEQIINGLVDDKVDGIWFVDGGDPGKPEIFATKMNQMLKYLHNKSPQFNSSSKFLTQKPIVGFCYCVPIILYLGARGMARGFHAPLFDGIGGLTAAQFDMLKSIFTGRCHEITVRGLTPRNLAAEDLISKQVQLSATVIGGLLQTMHSLLEQVLQVEDCIASHHQCPSYLTDLTERPISIISEKPIMLFIEALQFGNEGQLIDELRTHVESGRLNIKAVCIVDLCPKDESTKICYEQKITELSQFCQTRSIPVCSGLTAGHGPKAKQVVVPFGAAVISFDSVNSNLRVSYQSVEALTWGWSNDRFKKYRFWVDQKTSSFRDSVQLGNGPFSDHCPNFDVLKCKL